MIKKGLKEVIDIAITVSIVVTCFIAVIAFSSWLFKATEIVIEKAECYEKNQVIHKR